MRIGNYPAAYIPLINDLGERFMTKDCAGRPGDSALTRATPYSHSMVPGGLLVTSRTTRLISGTSLVIRLEIRASTSAGSRAQSAVIASSLVTGRSTMGWP